MNKRIQSPLAPGLLLLALFASACAPASPTAPGVQAPATPPQPPATIVPAPTHTPAAATAAPTRAATPTVRALVTHCPNAPAISNQQNSWAMISLHPPLYSNIRSAPSLQGERLGKLKPGEPVWIEDGPRCADGYSWWLVRSPEGLEGWTAEGDAAHYWLVQLKDAFFYNTVDQAVTSNAVLYQGQRYRISMSGTYSQWGPEQWTNSGVCIRGQAELLPMFPSPGKTNGPVGADSFYRFARPFYGPCQEVTDPAETVSPVMFSLDGGNTYAISVPSLAKYREDHKYRYEVIGRGYPLNVRLDDAPLEDNYGQLFITIEDAD
jgi:Bacterial SH3 domain